MHCCLEKQHGLSTFLTFQTRKFKFIQLEKIKNLLNAPLSVLNTFLNTFLNTVLNTALSFFDDFRRAEQPGAV